jgi:hypothetical protein
MCLIGPCQRTLPSQMRLLDTMAFRTGVRPDSVQVLGGTLSMRLPTLNGCGSLPVCAPVERRAEAWLQRGLPSS